MTTTPVLAAGQTRTLALAGATYTLRALTYGEHSALIAESAAEAPPTQAMLDEALIQAATEAGREDLAEMVRQVIETQDQASAILATRPPGLDQDGQMAWAREFRAEQIATEKAFRAAMRGRDHAMRLFAAAPKIAALRAEMEAASRRHTARLVAASVVALDGEEARLTLDQVAALPAAHVFALVEAANALLRPDSDAAKN